MNRYLVVAGFALGLAALGGGALVLRMRRDHEALCLAADPSRI